MATYENKLESHFYFFKSSKLLTQCGVALVLTFKLNALPQ